MFVQNVSLFFFPTLHLAVVSYTYGSNLLFKETHLQTNLFHYQSKLSLIARPPVLLLCAVIFFSPVEKLFSTKPSQTVNETLVHYDYNTCFNLKSQKL